MEVVSIQEDTLEGRWGEATISLPKGPIEKNTKYTVVAKYNNTGSLRRVHVLIYVTHTTGEAETIGGEVVSPGEVKDISASTTSGDGEGTEKVVIWECRGTALPRRCANVESTTLEVKTGGDDEPPRPDPEPMCKEGDTRCKNGEVEKCVCSDGECTWQPQGEPCDGKNFDPVIDSVSFTKQQIDAGDTVEVEVQISNKGDKGGDIYPHNQNCTNSTVDTCFDAAQCTGNCCTRNWHMDTPTHLDAGETKIITFTWTTSSDDTLTGGVDWFANAWLESDTGSILDKVCEADQVTIDPVTPKLTNLRVEQDGGDVYIKADVQNPEAIDGYFISPYFEMADENYQEGKSAYWVYTASTSDVDSKNEECAIPDATMVWAKYYISNTDLDKNQYEPQFKIALRHNFPPAYCQGGGATVEELTGHFTITNPY